MKDLLLAVADYTARANAALVGLLARAPAGADERPAGVYYQSVRGTMVHVLMADLAWLRRWAGLAELPPAEAARVRESELLGLPPESVKAEASASLEVLGRRLAEADALLAGLVAGLGEEELARRIRYVNMKGEALERALGDTLFHVMNHATHHRGEVSALLDQAGIANDLSGFTLYRD